MIEWQAQQMGDSGKKSTLPVSILLLLGAVLAVNACTSPTQSAVRPEPAQTATSLPALGKPHVEVVVEGLFGPIGMAKMPDGGLLVAEEGTGEEDDSAGISLITPDGQVGRLIGGLPSSRDSGDLAGVPMVAVAPDHSRIYLANFGQQHLWTLPLSGEEQNSLSLPDVPYTPDDLTPAVVRLNNVYLVNPFDIVFTEDGRPVVSDASENGMAVENADGTTRFFHRFPNIPNPVLKGDTIEAVPTGVEKLGEDEFMVTLTGGCPYPEGGGQLVAVDMARNQRTLIDGLNMPIDVARAADGTLWLLEFARFTPGASCFDSSGYEHKSGRLSRIRPDWTLEPLLTDLNFPGAVLPAGDGSLYISEVLTGRILKVTFDS